MLPRKNFLTLFFFFKFHDIQIEIERETSMHRFLNNYARDAKLKIRITFLVIVLFESRYF